MPADSIVETKARRSVMRASGEVGTYNDARSRPSGTMARKPRRGCILVCSRSFARVPQQPGMPRNDTMPRTRSLATVLVAAVLVAAVAGVSAPAAGQSVQYRSPAGVEYRSQPDTGGIARAEQALATDPRNVERFIQLGTAQSGMRQFREAIQTFTRGLAIAPNDPMLYRWRGHRDLSVREFDRAMDDLTRGYRLDSTNYGILYHLGIVRFARGDFAGAADAFARAQSRAPEAGELAGSTDWLWMSLSRAGRTAEATAMLARHPD